VASADANRPHGRLMRAASAGSATAADAELLASSALVRSAVRHAVGRLAFDVDRRHGPGRRSSRPDLPPGGGSATRPRRLGRRAPAELLPADQVAKLGLREDAHRRDPARVLRPDPVSINARHICRNPRVPGIVPRRAKEEQPLMRARYRRSMLPRIPGSLAGAQGATWRLARCIAPNMTLLPVARSDSAGSRVRGFGR
jgi:hypothetical protein